MLILFNFPSKIRRNLTTFERLFWLTGHAAWGSLCFGALGWPQISVHGQITPPALDTGRWGAIWTAVAVRQSLDSTGTQKIILYLGDGRLSVGERSHPLSRHGITIANAEYFYRYHARGMISTAFSYRYQHVYRQGAQGRVETRARQEYRSYTRFHYTFDTRRVQFSLVFRQEFRFFLSPGFERENEFFQPRSRILAMGAVYFDPRLMHRLSFRAEQLFSASIFTDRPPEAFRLNDTRLSAYYSLHLAKLTISLGAMQVFNAGKANSNVVVGADVMIRDPFKIPVGRRKPIKREAPKEKDDWDTQG